MKDTKTFLLLLVSILLITVSVFLLWTWTYRVKAIVATAENKPGSLSIISEQSIVSGRDSIQRFYNEILSGINKSIDSVKNSTDSLKGNFTGRLEEFIQLKSEISSLLESKVTDQNIIVARQKITELQLKINELRASNSDISQENKRLSALLAQLSGLYKNAAASQENYPGNEKRLATQRTSKSTAAEISTSDLRLTAVTEDSEDALDNDGEQSPRILGSFNVKNNSQQPNSIDLYVIVSQPDGKVLQRSTWETGTFDTREGRKIYSYKAKDDFNSGEIKKMSFSVSSEKLVKGNYSMQVYSRGVLLATISKPFS